MNLKDRARQLGEKSGKTPLEYWPLSGPPPYPEAWSEVEELVELAWDDEEGGLSQLTAELGRELTSAEAAEARGVFASAYRVGYVHAYREQFPFKP